MKKKIFIMSLVSIILILGVCLGIVEYIKQRDNKISLIQDNVIIEYGKTYDPILEELINLQEFNYIDVDKVKIESNIENEKNKEYPAVGVYEIKVNYKDKTLNQKIEVIDTVAPGLAIQENIEIDYGTDLNTFDFKNYITTSDLSELKDYNIDLSKVNSSASGEYETSIIIEDIYGNKAEKNFKIIILEKVEETIEEKPVDVKSKKTTAVASKGKKEQNEIIQESKDENSTELEQSDNSNDTNIVDNEQSNKQSNKQDNLYDIVLNPSRCAHDEEKTYYDTRDEALAQYRNKVKECDEKLKNGDIKTYEEYIMVCPYGHEEFSCPYCGKWTIELFYRK